MTSPADRILRDQVAGALYARFMIASQTQGQHLELALQCFRDADTFMTGRDEYHKLMAAKPAARQESDDDLAG